MSLPITTPGYNLITAADVASQRTTMGVAIGTDVQAYNAKLNTSATVNLPIIVSLKNISVLTSGSPADIASITLPTWLTGWALSNGSSLTLSRIIAETASGTLTTASFSFRDAANGGGNQVGTAASGPTAAGLGVAILGIGPTTAGRYTSGTIYINQTANSGNAGTVSFYLTIVPYL